MTADCRRRLDPCASPCYPGGATSVTLLTTTKEHNPSRLAGIPCRCCSQWVGWGSVSRSKMAKKKQPRVTDGVVCWRCPQCELWIPVDSYYKDHLTANGLKCHCKICHGRVSYKAADKIKRRRSRRIGMRRARERDPGKYNERERVASKNRIKGKKHRARAALNRAVRRGILIRPSVCSQCKRKRKTTAHHNDYDKPLEVEWLCYECHGERSWTENRINPGAGSRKRKR